MPKLRPLETYEYLERIGYRVDGSAYSIDNVPYLKRFFEAARDWRTRRLVMPCSVQSGKSIAMQNQILCQLSQDPRNILYFAQDDANSLEFSQTRMHPDLNAYLSHRMYDTKAKTKNSHIIFRGGAWLSMSSGNNRKNLQSRTAQRVWNDEASILESGRLDEAERRGDAYQLFDQFHGIVSTPENVGTDFHAYWLDSTMEEWSIGCKSCSNVQAIRLPAFKWDSNDITRPDGEWDWDEMAKTLRVACVCGKETHVNDTRAWRELMSTAHYVQTNTRAPRDHIGVSYSGLAVPRRSPVILVRRFLGATDTYKKNGLIAPLKEVIQKDMGEFWQPNEYASEGDPYQTGGYLMGDTDWSEEYILNAEHRCRNMTVDVQKTGFYYVIRMWSRQGHSRLLTAGFADTWDELEHIRDEHGVWAGVPRPSKRWMPARVFVDNAWQRGSSPGLKTFDEVNRHLAKYNYFGMAGSNQKDSWTIAQKNGAKIQRPWSTIETKSVGTGNYLKSFFYGVTTVSSHLINLMTQNTEQHWETPDDPPDGYFEQLGNKYIDEKTGKYVGKDDHFFDCEKMQLIPAYNDGLFPGAITANDG
jgi:hypothetical protein